MFARKLCAVLLFVAAVSASFAADDVGKPIRIVLVGDSTVASYANPPKDRPDLTGWGQVFGECFDDRVTVLNHARSGRSTKSFVAEGLWQKALEARGDYIFIQFGHNDSHMNDGKPVVAPDTAFRDYLRQYIDQSRAAGAKPVLVTPVARRTFVGGKIQTGLQPYADAMLKVGKERNVPVIDLHAASMALFDRLGDEGSSDLTASASDRTHFSRKGALAIARLVAETLPQAVPELRPYLKAAASTDGEKTVAVLPVMGNNQGTRRIYLAWSKDGRTWETRRTPLLDPPAGTNQIAQAWHFPWQGRHYLIFHGHLADSFQTANLYAAEIDPAFERPTHLGLFYDHASAAPDNVAQMSPCFLTQGDTIYMYTNIGPRLNQKIALAVAPAGAFNPRQEPSRSDKQPATKEEEQ
jgi:lysophospholipase L1-like esterase